MRWVLVTALIAAMVVVILAAVIAAPPFVQVLATSEDAAVRAAGTLRAELAGDGRLRLSDEVLVVTNGADPITVGDDLKAIAALVDEADLLYVGLNAPEALAKIAEARAKLGLMLDRPQAAAVLARAMRIKGLVFLFMENAEQAATAFFSAYLLSPEFVPDSQQWPPEARLAYADAVAAARRSPGGILSVDITPPVATLWLNGRKAGIGPTTVSGIAPGEHFGLATCPGFNRVAALVTVAGGGKLSQAALYLAEQPPEIALRAQAAAFADAFGSDDEERATRLLAEQLGAEVLIYVANQAGAQAAWVLAASGERQREPVVIVSGNDAAAEIRVAILGEEPETIPRPIPPPPPPAPQWYERWEVWMVVGAAVAVAGGTAIYIGASRGRNVTILVGDQ